MYTLLLTSAEEDYSLLFKHFHSFTSCASPTHAQRLAEREREREREKWTWLAEREKSGRDWRIDHKTKQCFNNSNKHDRLIFMSYMRILYKITHQDEKY